MSSSDMMQSGTKNIRMAKVNQSDLEAIGNHHVIRLQITMSHAIESVKTVHCKNHLLQEV